MRLIHRPLGMWPRPSSPSRDSLFTASWSDTLEILEREVTAVRRRDQVAEPVILQLDIPESAIRLDGGVRANARAGSHRVAISFESKHGPLRYLCDTYDTPAWKVRGTQQAWQANVRAIALGLEALRTVDRYGISHDGEQYRGFTALPPAREVGPAMTVEDAARAMLRLAGLAVEPGGNHVARVRADFDSIYRQAAKRVHPDLGGAADLFRQLQQCAELLRGLT